MAADRVRIVAEAPVLGRRLGRHEEHDARSAAYAVEATTRKLRSVEWQRRAPIFDQGDLGSCTGNAMAGWIGCDREGHAGDAQVSERTAVALYSLATTLDAIPGRYPPSDTGSSGLAVCKAARESHYISGYRHAFSLQAALSALQTGPLITGVPWLAGMDTPDPDGRIHATGRVRGGHEFLVRGIDTTARTVLCDNSWGPGWAAAGSFLLSWDDWGKLLTDHGDVTVPSG